MKGLLGLVIGFTRGLETFICTLDLSDITVELNALLALPLLDFFLVDLNIQERVDDFDGALVRLVHCGG